MALSLAKLQRFVSTRNKSGFSSNLQFGIDADECGFSSVDLGQAMKTDDGYSWRTPFGILRESSRGKMHLEAA